MDFDRNKYICSKEPPFPERKRIEKMGKGDVAGADFDKQG
jgi:hypothetical protein